MKENTGHIAEILRKFLSGKLNEEEQNRLEEWLNASPHNKQFLESFRQAKNIEDDLYIVRKLDANKAWNKLKNKNRTGITSIGKWSLGIAATITFLVGSFVLWRTELTTDNSKEKHTVIAQPQDIAPATSGAILVLADGTKISLDNDSTKTLTKNNNLVGNSNELIVKATDQAIPTQYNSLIVPKASFYKMTLADGTRVWVNALSQLKFPAQFSKTERRVFLEGEA